MDNSPLSKLPPELRLVIYELVLHRSLPIRLTCKISNKSRVDNLFWIGKANGKHPLAVTMLCRRVREEALQTFYRINSFEIVPRVYTIGGQWTIPQTQKYTTDLTTCKRWLRSIGPFAASQIRCFLIHSGHWEIADVKWPSGRWWKHSRKIEKKLLHNAGLNISATQAIINVQFHVWPWKFVLGPWGETQHTARCSRTVLQSSKYSTVSFSLPTEDRSLAREEAEIQYQAKREMLEDHLRHQDCWVAAHMPTLLFGLEKAYNNVVGILSQKDESKLEADWT